MQFNWIDWIITLVIVYVHIDGWKQGFISLVSKSVSFLVSLWIAVRYHALVGQVFIAKIGLPRVWTNVLGYIVLGIASEIFLRILLGVVVQRAFSKSSGTVMNRWLGSVFAVTNALVVLAFVLLVVMNTPLRGDIKNDIRKSTIASRLVLLSETYGGTVRSSLQPLAKEIQFLTIKPRSGERVELPEKPSRDLLSVDTVGELEMVQRVNAERDKVGLPALRIDMQLVILARKHSVDMFESGYFSHINVKGQDAGQRAQRDGIVYVLMGENLAYAPDIDAAHTGLMKSERHRNNILDSAWSRVGIGIIDGKVFGTMITQVFAD